MKELILVLSYLLFPGTFGLVRDTAVRDAAASADAYPKYPDTPDGDGYLTYPDTPDGDGYLTYPDAPDGDAYPIYPIKTRPPYDTTTTTTTRPPDYTTTTSTTRPPYDTTTTTTTRPPYNTTTTTTTRPPYNTTTTATTRPPYNTTTTTTTRPCDDTTTTTTTSPPDYTNDIFYQMWIKYDGEPVYLNAEDASYFYSLGQYRPGDYNRPNSYYPAKPQYYYPLYGGGSGTQCTRCTLIPGPKRRRIELRQMSDAERTAYHNAILALSNYCPSGCTPCPSGTCRSAFGIFVELHQSINSPGAHLGCAFLPWHREYLFRFENALIQDGNYPDTLGLPTWDSILDSSLPNARASVLWTPWYAGPNSGIINAAPFPGLSVPGLCGGTVNRGGSGSNSYLFQEADVTVLMNQMCFAHLCQNNAWTCPSGICNFEGRHNWPHVWVGGDMGSYCSAIDPIFWMHHGFIDCLWEGFRNNAQMTDLEREYPLTNHGGPIFDWDETMYPFLGLFNVHGLSTHYTRYYYDCAERPSAIVCSSDQECNPRDTTNPALWCDPLFGRCRSRIQSGGSCLRSSVNMPDAACWCPTLTPYCVSGVCTCS